MTSRLAWVVGAGLMLAACHPTRSEQATVRRWLLCEECNEGELDSVVALGSRVVTVLGEALAGPPATGRENIRLQASAMFARIPAPLVPQGVYVQHFVDNYVATYQTRAAIALALIPTPTAHKLLLDAVRSDSAYRDDVLRAIGAAAEISLAPADSSSQSAPVDSFVRINPTVVVLDLSDPTAPQPLADVLVLFRVQTGGGRVTDSIVRTRGSGTATVRWQLGPSIDSANVLRVVAAGRTVQFRATGRGLDPRVVFIAQPTNVVEGDPFTPPIQISVLDAWDQVVTQFTGFAVLSVVGAGDSLIVPVVAGRADFSSFILSSSATGVRLRAGAAGAREATSQAFDVLP